MDVVNDKIKEGINEISKSETAQTIKQEVNQGMESLGHKVEEVKQSEAYQNLEQKVSQGVETVKQSETYKNIQTTVEDKLDQIGKGLQKQQQDENQRDN